jgi:hypothetical protein
VETSHNISCNRGQDLQDFHFLMKFMRIQLRRFTDLGLLWIEGNFGGKKKNELSPHLKIPLFFL